MILFDKNELLKALNTELDEYAELADVIKFIEDYEKYHSVIRSEGRPILIIDDRVAYLTEDHIEALKEYERKKMYEEALDNLITSFNDIKFIDADELRRRAEE